MYIHAHNILVHMTLHPYSSYGTNISERWPPKCWFMDCKLVMIFRMFSERENEIKKSISWIRQTVPKVSCLVSKMYIKIRYKYLYYLLNLQKLFEMRSSMFNTQFTTLWYRSANWLAGLNLNIPANKREGFRLTDFWATLYLRPFLLGHRPSFYKECPQLFLAQKKATTLAHLLLCLWLI
jgi:hypothetical protein